MIGIVERPCAVRRGCPIQRRADHRSTPQVKAIAVTAEDSGVKRLCPAPIVVVAVDDQGGSGGAGATSVGARPSMSSWLLNFVISVAAVSVWSAFVAPRWFGG